MDYWAQYFREQDEAVASILQEDVFNVDMTELSDEPESYHVQDNEQLGSGASEPFEVLEVATSTRKNRRLNYDVIESIYKLKHNLTSRHDLLQASDGIDLFFRKISAPIFQNVVDDEDRITITIENENFTRGSLFVHTKKKFYSVVDVYNKLLDISQSNSKIFLEGIFNVTVGILRPTIGSAPFDVVSKWEKRKGALITINNVGNSCGHLAVYIANIAYDKTVEGKVEAAKIWKKHMHHKDRKNSLIMENTKKLAAQISPEIDILQPLRVPTDLEKYARGIGRTITVFKRHKEQFSYQAEHEFTCPIPGTKAHLFIERVYDGDKSHFNAIIPTKVHCYFQKGNKAYRSFCNDCLVPILRGADHICKDSCPSCRGGTHEGPHLDLPITCEYCAKSFHFQECYQDHISNEVCCKTCPDCLVDIHPRKKHTCLNYLCKTCGSTYKDSPHYCLMKPIKESKMSRNSFLVVFDIESMFVDQGGDECHQPILLISLTVCDICFNMNGIRSPTFVKPNNCTQCGKFKNVFEGKDCIKKFCDYLFGGTSTRDRPLIQQARRCHSTVRILAHNFKGYDGKFLIRELYNRELQPSIAIQGSKLLSISINQVREEQRDDYNCTFLDSMSFMPGALSKLPKTFGFEDVVKKGYFPYLFNTPENLSHRSDHLPDLNHYGYDTMKEGHEKEALQKWHEEHYHSVFDLRKEMEDYCLDDCKILLLAVQIFRRTFLDLTNIDPIQKCITLPSFAMTVFRTMFLQETSIGITPVNGYNQMTHEVSVESQVWLDYLQWKNGIRLLREFRKGRVFADGYHQESNTVFEFNGCYFHGCPKHERTASMTEKYEKWVWKCEYYKHLQKKADPTLQVVQIWECDWMNSLQNLPLEELDYILSRSAYYRSIKEGFGVDMRGGYYGGRTNNRKFYHVAVPGEEIKYMDFVSLYPSRMVACEYPTGHPEVIREDFPVVNGRFDISRYFGLIACRVRPPNSLTFPILPLRINSRLVFTLCRTCAEQELQQHCEHQDNDRDLYGTFFTPELNLAIENGYQIIEIFEVYNYTRKTSSIFQDYVKMFLKIKQEASGWPRPNMTDEEQDAYISQYHSDAGIQLEKSSIRKDETRRHSAKLMLNSLYGKFAQDPNLTKFELVTTFERLWKLLEDPSKTICSCTNVIDDKCMVTFKESDQKNCKPGQTSVAIAGFVTSYARVHLWDLLNRIENRCPGSVLYYDTDSVVYIHRQGEPEEPTGTLLGQLTDELAPNKCYRAAFLGPKNYFLELTAPDGTKSSIIKVKGITLTGPALQQITPDRMMEMAAAYCEQGITETEMVPQSRFHCINHHNIISNLNFEKTFRPVSRKRVVVGNDTIPYGTRIR